MVPTDTGSTADNTRTDGGRDCYNSSTMVDNTNYELECDVHIIDEEADEKAELKALVENMGRVLTVAYICRYIRLVEYMIRQPKPRSRLRARLYK